MQTLTRCICEPLPYISNPQKSLKERTNKINKLRKEYPKAKIYYDSGFVMCEYREAGEIN
jgi:hypothetical protein